MKKETKDKINDIVDLMMIGAQFVFILLILWVIYLIQLVYSRCNG